MLFILESTYKAMASIIFFLKWNKYLKNKLGSAHVSHSTYFNLVKQIIG